MHQSDIQIGFIPILNSGKYYTTTTYGAIYYQVNQTTTTLLEKIIMVVYEFIYGKKSPFSLSSQPHF